MNIVTTLWSQKNVNAFKKFVKGSFKMTHRDLSHKKMSRFELVFIIINFCYCLYLKFVTSVLFGNSFLLEKVIY